MSPMYSGASYSSALLCPPRLIHARRCLASLMTNNRAILPAGWTPPLFAARLKSEHERVCVWMRPASGDMHACMLVRACVHAYVSPWTSEDKQLPAVTLGPTRAQNPPVRAFWWPFNPFRLSFFRFRTLLPEIFAWLRRALITQSAVVDRGLAP